MFLNFSLQSGAITLEDTKLLKNQHTSIIRGCTNPLLGAFQPQIEAQPKRHPLEVLEAEHGLEAGVPDVGCEAEVRGAGIVFKDKFRVEPAVAEPERSEPI